VKTQVKAVLDELKKAAAEGQEGLAPSLFSHFYGRGATAAAFRMAKAQGLIEVAFISCAGTPVYRGVKPKPVAPPKLAAPICPICRECTPVAAYGGWVCTSTLYLAKSLPN
jgi:hypothetical protein